MPQLTNDGVGPCNHADIKGDGKCWYCGATKGADGQWQPDSQELLMQKMRNLCQVSKALGEEKHECDISA
jgi:hypothetical protein